MPRGRVAISGYDRGTDNLVVTIYVAPPVVNELREVVGVPDTDPDLLGSYPIEKNKLPQSLQDTLTPRRASLEVLDYFLESWED